MQRWDWESLPTEVQRGAAAGDPLSLEEFAWWIYSHPPPGVPRDRLEETLKTFLAGLKRRREGGLPPVRSLPGLFTRILKHLDCDEREKKAKELESRALIPPWRSEIAL